MKLTKNHAISSVAARRLAVFWVVLAIGCGEDKTAADAAVDAGADQQATGGQECDDCAKDTDCGDGLTCDKPSFVCKTPKQVKTGAPVCDVDCAESDFCRDDGLCSIDGLVCEAKLLAHCLPSVACKSKGECSVVAGKCGVSSDGDCQQGDVCKVDGKCTHKDGACVETANVKCGDGKCEGAETKQSCASDCGPVGGDPCPCDAGVCGTKEGCPNDCGACTAGKWCYQNTCTDAKCALPDKWPTPAQRITKLVLLNHKLGCDQDDSGKANNVMGKLLTVYSAVNEHAFTALQTFALNLLLTTEGYNVAGKAFGLTLLDGDLTKPKEPCNPDHATCDFVAKAHSYDVLAKTSSCPAIAHVAAAKVTANKLVAGGVGNGLNLAVYIVGVPLIAKLKNVELSGTVSGGSEWQTTTNGRICGALTLVDLAAAVDTLPESALLGTGMDKAKVKDLVNGLFTPDLDLDGDGKFDAISAAWAFETGPANVTGVK